ncbi:MAG TPA: LamG-like jellyroll fold domain-containing protein, partial [Candidatus Nanoarchaeia archaeon]|nr:LamG-like jellyroll fold domain-containing protein [Candidatus Nanoarchaeia archaeon]
MKPDYNLEALNLRKRAVERAAKVVTLKLEKTRYLYNIEKEKRKSAAIKQLRVLLEYETRELDRAKAELREIAVKMILLEQEKQKQAKTRMKGIAVLLIFSLAFAGLLVQYGLHYYDAGVAPEFIVETADTSNAPNFSITDRFLAFLEKLGHYRSDNSLTGAVIGIPVGNCHEEITCVNQTTTHCVNETVQKCDAACVNETIESCSEQCLPNCVIEEINGKEREVCTTSCSTVCSTETVQNCGGCSEVMEEKCSSEIVEQCSTETVCDEPVESGVAAEIVEESPTVEIQPIEEAAEDISEELDIQPIEEEIPQDDVTGGAITIPELEEPELEVPVEGSAGELEVQPIEEESSELDVQPIIEEPVEEIPDISEPETQPIETIPPEQAEDEPEMPAEIVEEPIEDEEEVPPEVVEPEEKSFFASMIQSIKAALTPELDPLALSIIYTRLNTTFVTSGVAANLTAHVNTTEGLSKITYNWFRNGTSITKLNVPFEKINSTTTNNSRDYSGNKYNMNPLGGVTWNATGGYDGKGAYTLKGTAAQNLSIYNMSFPTTALSVAFWLLTNGSGDGIISYAPSDPENNEFLLFEQTNLAVYTNNGAVTTGVTGLSDGRWHHVVVTWRSSTGRIEVYKDGQLNYSQTTGSTAALNNTRRGCLTIGQDNDDYCGQYQAGQALIGTVDELLIFDRVINADQVFALWSNQSNTIIDREVFKGEKWTVEATPNDGSIDGAPKMDHYYIYQPVIHSLVLNSTNTSTNSSDVNITAYVVTADSDNDEVKVTYNWLVNNSPIAILNMPFEQVNFTGFNNSWDYSGLGNNGNETGGSGANWSATAGYDGKGAYSFNGLNNNNFITLSENGYWKNLCISGCTFSVWVTVGERGVGPELILSRGNTQSTFFEFSTGRTAGQGASLGVNFNGSISGNPSPRCDVSTTGGLVYNKGVSWNHIVGVYNLSHIAIYINGTQNILEPCPIYGLNATIWQNNSRVLIGARDNAGSTSNNFNGTIDELMVFNRSLTEAQIRALWLNQTNIIVAQETVRGENWTVFATPMNGTFNGTVVRSNNVTILNAKPTQATPLLNTTNVSSNNTNVNLTGINLSTADIDNDAVKNIYNWLLNGISIAVLNMPFEGVNSTSYNNTWDYSGYGNNGIIDNATWNATGGYDGKGAYQFNGSNGVHIGFLNNASLDVNGSLTLAAWTKSIPSPSAFRTILWHGSGSADYILRILTTGELIALFRNASTNDLSVTSTNRLLNNSWQHIAVVYDIDNSNLSLYIDGVMNTSNVSPGYGNIKDTGRFEIGNFFPTHTQTFNGTIDEVMVFNRSLSVEQIQAIYRNETDTIVAQETAVGDIWSVEVTPNDGFDDGQALISNNVTILNTKPTHTTPLLNTTNVSSNNTFVNLTAINLSTADTDNDAVKNIYNWLVDSKPIAVLNMPFEGINSTTSNNAWDYSGLGNNGSETNGVFWNATGGYDGKGAYQFDGIDDYINVSNANYFKGSLCINGCTFSAWAKGVKSGVPRIIGRWQS